MGSPCVPVKKTILLARSVFHDGKSVSIRWLSVRHYLSWRQKMRVVLKVVNDLEKSRFVAFSVTTSSGSRTRSLTAEMRFPRLEGWEPSNDSRS